MTEHITESEKDRALDAALEKIQGTWQLQYWLVDGKELNPDEADVRIMITVGTTFRFVSARGQVAYDGMFSIDPGKSPKEVDAVVTTGPNAGTVSLGIYEVEGDTKRACWAAPGNKRPTEFEAGVGSNRTLQVWKRISEI